MSEVREKKGEKKTIKNKRRGDRKRELRRLEESIMINARVRGKVEKKKR